MKVWRLKKGSDRRFRTGHPWVFASELGHSAKEVEPGEIVELRDATNHFLAYGHAHPTAQICFRRLSSREKEKDVVSVDYFSRRLQSALDHRRLAGWVGFSYRWVFGEADAVPGLVVDLYHRAEGGTVAVVQATTAGMERALPNLYAALEELTPAEGSMTIVESPTSRNRRLEGLEVGEKKVVFGSVREGYDSDFIFVDGVRLRADLIHGQKTGFFLDQQVNVQRMKIGLKNISRSPSHTLRVLDICCYVGQWGAHAAAAMLAGGRTLHVTLVDSSEAALSFAKHNVAHYSGDVRALHGDALEVVTELGEEAFDVIICDPPAFVKKKADLEAGLRAYTKLNREALKRLAPGGIYVASSCSGLVRGDDWRQVLSEASLKSGRGLRRLFVGGHGPDHPVRPEFPEGEYLKCEILTAST